ncbi:MAG: ECF transporter S component [Erysipelothrix sp.]|jgi:uncharacterized membrane protein|nr:ECF transporter S component [Erysipelothrix sp.]
MKNIKWLALASLLMALIALVTIVGMVPIVWGYLNLGDSVIMLSATLLPIHISFIIGGAASAFADVWMGYSQYAIFTLIIKGMEGLMVGYLYQRLSSKLRKFVPFVVGGLWIAMAYGGVDALLYQDWHVGLASFGLNSIQGFASALIGIVFAHTITPKLRKLLPKNATYE